MLQYQTTAIAKKKASISPLWITHKALDITGHFKKATDHVKPLTDSLISMPKRHIYKCKFVNLLNASDSDTFSWKDSFSIGQTTCQIPKVAIHNNKEKQEPHSIN